MAFGIFIYRVLEHFSWLVPYEKALVIILFIVWMAMIMLLIKDWIHGSFRKAHLKDPVNLFALGTWIAGTSIVVNVLSQYFSSWLFGYRILAIFNMIAWGIYILLCLQAYRVLFRTPMNHGVHGIILLTTVSTQSLVLLLNTILSTVPYTINTVLIGAGFGFYAMGFYLLFKRYISVRQWHFIDDWPASNCIVHGAMSITGLASVMSGVVDKSLILWVWIWVVCWFLLIECAEIVRAFWRIRRFGPVTGIGEYHVTHWSRIFTFCMFYAFTKTLYWPDIQLFDVIRQGILDVLPWLVLILLINETLLYVKKRLT
ncbi:MAG TPA: hypothetical protein VFK33_13155 [Bacillales bacterium]|nr:hypothetical protein [Bacillales bacterium]